MLSTGGSTGGAGGSVSVSVGSGDTGDGGAVTLTAGTTTASTGIGGSLELTAGAGGSTGDGGSVNIHTGSGTTNGGFYVYSPLSTTAAFKITDLELLASSSAISLISTTSNIQIDATTAVAITGTSTTISGGPLYVDAQDFVVSNGTADVFFVDASTGDVDVKQQLKFSANTAAINHSGTTSLSVSSPQVVFKTGDVVLDGSWQSTGPNVNAACVLGMVRHDSSYLYLCMGDRTTAVWKRVQLVAA